jgi:hypothetical protein
VVVVQYGANDVLPWGSPQGGKLFGLTDRERAAHVRFLYGEHPSRLLLWIQTLLLPAPQDLDDLSPARAAPRVPIGEFRENLVTLTAEAPRSVLLVWPLRRQLEPDRDLGPLVGIMRGFPLERFREYQEVIRSLESPDRRVLDVGRAFLESGGGIQSLFHDSIHASERGHRVVADALHAVLRDMEDGE